MKSRHIIFDGRVNQALNAALADADVKDRFARLGAEPTGGTPQAFAAMVKTDTAKWKKSLLIGKLAPTDRPDARLPAVPPRQALHARRPAGQQVRKPSYPWLPIFDLTFAAHP